MKRILRLPNKDMAAASLFSFLNAFSGALKRTSVSVGLLLPFNSHGVEGKGRKISIHDLCFLFLYYYYYFKNNDRHIHWKPYFKPENTVYQTAGPSGIRAKGFHLILKVLPLFLFLI